MKYEELCRRKDAAGYTNEKIAELSGIPVETVERFFMGTSEDHDYKVWMILEKMFLSVDTETADIWTGYTVCEGKTAYGSLRKEHTVEDYYNLSEDKRAELIDGIIYDMAAPSSIHQAIAAQIYVQLSEYISGNGGNCFPALSPLDVQLDCDDKTMVQPDVMVICDRSKIAHGIYGAPDLIIEILSESTRLRDAGIKRIKYRQAGVREYWMVDPNRKKVIVYDFEHDQSLKIYSFDDKIPVKIFQGNCQIDFKRIYKFIRFLYDNLEN